MRKVILTSLVGISALFILVGCEVKVEKKFTAKTKAYYDTHKDEAKARLKQCEKLIEYSEQEQIDCNNAQDAIIDNKGNWSNPYENPNPNALKWK